jgi:hypothetical protein
MQRERRRFGERNVAPLPQLGRAADVAAPLVEGDADLEPVVTHWYLAHPARDRSRVPDAYGLVVPDVKPDTD